MALYSQLNFNELPDSSEHNFNALLDSSQLDLNELLNSSQLDLNELLDPSQHDFNELPDPSPRDSSNSNLARKKTLFACIFTTLCLILLIVIMPIVFTLSVNRKQYPPRIDVIEPIARRTPTTGAAPTNCFPTSWNPIGDVVATGAYFGGVAVDEDFNVYAPDGNRQLLQKWLPGATQPINLLSGFIFAPFFFHSPTRSIYFIDMFYPFVKGVYKLALGSITPVIVVASNGTGSSLNQLQSNCRGLYVNKLGDIFVLDSENQRVLKWTVNASSGILVAGGGGQGNGTTQLSDPHGIFVDELNNVIYVADTANNRILKYLEGSVSGVIVININTYTTGNNVALSHDRPNAIFVDRTGNILFSVWTMITKWTPGAKNGIIVATGDQGSGANVMFMQTASAFAFDKLGNLYAVDWENQRVLKFNSTSSSCTIKIL